MDDLEVRELRYFVAVAEELNFTRAAARLHMAQPPLSKSVQGLERKLGVSLLERTSRHVRLTDAGEVLYQQARIALDAVTAAGRRATRAGEELRRLVVAVKPGPDVELLHEIRAGYEELDGFPPVLLSVGGRGEQLAMLRDGRADVAVFQGVVDGLEIDHEVLRSEDRMAVLPVGHPLASKAPLHRADLLGEPVPVWPGSTAEAAGYVQGLDLLPRPWPVVPAGPVVNNMAEMLSVVALGQAVAFAAGSVAAQYPAIPVLYRPIADLSPATLVVAWPRASRSAAVGAFVRTAIMISEAAQASDPADLADPSDRSDLSDSSDFSGLGAGSEVAAA